MLSWIPLLGPIIQGLSSIFNGFFNEKIQLSATAANKEIEEAKVSAQIIQTTNDDVCLRIMRDCVILPVAIWTMLIGWDTIIVHHWPTLMWHPEKYPDSVAYLPYVVLVFLFGNIGLNMWKSK